VDLKKVPDTFSVFPASGRRPTIMRNVCDHAHKGAILGRCAAPAMRVASTVIRTANDVPSQRQFTIGPVFANVPQYGGPALAKPRLSHPTNHPVTLDLTVGLRVG
jgi:hypothetical protein